ncbi:hypothetical protein HG530_007687 [Fusarium avenaceum]|nr:hypothetical protein HG530_007687 [Fusarium avenaceum]
MNQAHPLFSSQQDTDNIRTSKTSRLVQMSTYYRGGRGGWRDGRGRDDVRCHHCRHYGHRANECRLLLREQLLQMYNYLAQVYGFPVLTAATPSPAALPVPAPAVAHWAPLAAPPLAAPGGQYGFPPGAAAAPAPAAPPVPALPAPAAPGPALSPGFPYPTATAPSPGPPAPSGEGGSEMEIS